MTKYKRNFLDKVVWRIDFEPVSFEKVAQFKDLIISLFPNERRISNTQVSVTFGSIEKDVKREEKEVSSIEYSSNNGQKRLVLGNNFCVLEFDKYQDSLNLLKNIEAIANALEKVFNISSISRCGLRYINVLRFSEIVAGFKYNTYINPKLLGALNFAKTIDRKSSIVARAMSELTVNWSKYLLTLRYGVFNTNYPAINVKKEFILDLDCYSILPIDMNETSLKDLAKEYNSKIEQFFEASITEKLRDLLNKD